MSLEIIEVATPKELKQFIQFPHVLYEGNAFWVPSRTSEELKTLSPEFNPAFEFSQARYWVAKRDGKVIGRIAAIHSQAHQQRWNQAFMRFGWIDFVDDEEVSAALMEKVETWAREKGLSAVHGPLGFTDMDQAGMLVEGFDELSTLATIYNYPYYPQHLERLGYVKDTDWVEYEMEVPPVLDERIKKLAKILMTREKLRLVECKSKQDALQFAPEIFSLFNEGYQNLYGFVPLNKGLVDYYTRQYLGFINPEYVPLVVNEEGKLVAFGITMPSMSRAMQKAHGRLFPFGFVHLLRAMKKNDRADLYLVVVKPEYQGKGINALLISQIAEVFVKHGIQKVESNPELETNHQVQAQWKYFNNRQHKRRRCYIKHLV